MIYDVLIIGAGPAGLSAAIYAQRAQLSSLILEKEYMCGGQMLNTYQVDNYPGLPGIGGVEMGLKFREQAESLGASFVNKEAKQIKEQDNGKTKTVYTNDGEFYGRSVILSMGAHYRKLEIPGEQRLTGRGVSYCATCDGAFFKGRAVAVVGGGDVAAEDALFLSRICSKVYLIHRRNELRAAKILQEDMKKCDNIEFLWNTELTEIYGDEQVEQVLLRNKKDGSESSLNLDGVFIAAGTIPNTGIVKEMLQLDEQGYIKAAEDGSTNIPGIFAAGDVRTKNLRQIVTAVSDGANVISSIEAYLRTFK